MVGTALMFGVKNLVARNPKTVKKWSANVFNLFKKLKRKKNRETEDTEAWHNDVP